MSTLQVSNVNFESTANNQLVYAANTLTVRAGGANVLFANATTLSVNGNINANGVLTINVNNKALRFQTVNSSAYSYMIQQNDDNFVFYTTDTSYAARAVYSIFANSTTSNVNFSVPVNINANLGVSTNTLNLGTSSIGANGYSRLPNGLLMQWGNIAASVNNTTTATITFPTTFTTFYSGSVTLLNATSVATTNPGVSATITANSATTLTWRTTSTAAAASATIYWWAIGV